MVALAYTEPILAIAFFLVLICLFRSKNGLPWNWPLLGMSPTLLLNFHRLYELADEILEISGGTYLFKGLWFSNMDMWFTSDPENVHYITTTNYWNYPKGPESMQVFDTLGNSLFNLDFEEWTYYRGLLHAFFSHQKFHQFVPKVLVDNVNKGLVPFLEDVAKQALVVDLQDMFKRHIYDAACAIATGYNPKTLSIGFEENAFVRAMDDACVAMLTRHILPGRCWKLLRWLQIGSEKRLSVAKGTLRQIVTNYMATKREELSAGAKTKEDEETFDVLRSFLTINDVNDKEHPDEIVRDSTIGIIFAAYDTSSATLSWFFWLLSKNPHVETKIREELDSNFSVKEGQNWQLNSRKELSKLVYLHATLCETLRLYPPVPLQSRTPVRPDIFPSGHHVDPKAIVVLSGYAIGRMARVWGQDCHEFKPERWINEKGDLKYERSAKFFTFNAGPRICPGKEMAFSIMKAAAATILYNYHVQVVETRPVTPKASIILQMKHGLRARICSRWT
jgi:cytochrome P450